MGELFKDIVSRDHGEPWGATGMTSRKWLEVPTQLVTIRDLIATQPGVYLRALMDPQLPVGGDPLPHVIAWAGELYLEDGHHRAMQAHLSGAKTMLARVLIITTGTEAQPWQEEGQLSPAP